MRKKSDLTHPDPLSWPVKPGDYVPGTRLITIGEVKHPVIATRPWSFLSASLRCLLIGRNAEQSSTAAVVYAAHR